MALNSAINTGALGTGFIYSDGAGLLSSTTGMLITKFTASGTWTKDSKTKMVTIIAWNAGGGGGSGRRGLTTASGGGGGGGGGAFLFWSGFGTYFNTTETVTIGGAGTGGAVQTADTTNGNVGISGGATSIGNIIIPTVANRGNAGTATTAGGGTTPVSWFSMPVSITITPPAGGQGSNTTGTNAVSVTWDARGANYWSWSNCGGGGSGANSVTPQQAGNGGSTISIGGGGGGGGTTVVTGGAGGIESGTIGGGAGSPFLSNTGGILYAASGGGGGGGQNAGGSAGSGGNGGVPGAGGGGGGGSLNGTNSGAGGDGGRGELWVIEYF